MREDLVHWRSTHAQRRTQLLSSQLVVVEFWLNSRPVVSLKST